MLRFRAKTSTSAPESRRHFLIAFYSALANAIVHFEDRPLKSRALGTQLSSQDICFSEDHLPEEVDRVLKKISAYCGVEY